MPPVHRHSCVRLEPRPHAAHAASAIKCKLFHFCANCCATFFSCSVRAHHQKQIIDSSRSRLSGKRVEEAANCSSLSLSLSLLLLIFHVPPRPKFVIIAALIRITQYWEKHTACRKKKNCGKVLPRWKCDCDCGRKLRSVLWLFCEWVLQASLALPSYLSVSRSLTVAQWHKQKRTNCRCCLGRVVSSSLTNVCGCGIATCCCVFVANWQRRNIF